MSSEQQSLLQKHSSGEIYVLRFSRPLGDPSNPKGYATHYTGYCDAGRVDERLAEHRSGRGAKITAAAAQQGIEMDIVLWIPGDRWVERAIKNRGNTPKFVEQVQKSGVPASIYTTAEKLHAEWCAKYQRQ